MTLPFVHDHLLKRPGLPLALDSFLLELPPKAFGALALRRGKEQEQRKHETDKF